MKTSPSAPTSYVTFAAYPVLRRVLAVIAGLAVLVALVVFFFPWDALRGPLNRYMSERLGRRFEITQHLAVKLRPFPWGRTTVRAEGVEFANPDWAKEPYLVKAAAAEFEIKLWPLLLGKVNMPRVALVQPVISLQIEPDGRRTWALSRDTSDAGAAPTIGALTIDQGTVKYVAAARGADIAVQFSLAPDTGAPAPAGTAVKPAPGVPDVLDASNKRDPAAASPLLPLRFQATGRWKNEAFKASGRAGGVLQLSQNVKGSFPLEINAVAGKTTLKAKGSIENLAELSGLDTSFDLRGNNLEELYKLLGVVLPSTPPYKLQGHLQKRGEVWSASKLSGVLGGSDLSGDLSFDTSSAMPLLTGKVQSKLLDFADLRPVIGLPVATPAVVANQALAAPEVGSASRKVLPTATLDLVRLQAMNADVVYSAADIRHVEQLPLDKGSVHVKLANGVLQLAPVALGVAGGSLAGRITVDTNTTPATFETRLDVTAVQLNKLFPTIETTKSSLGKISGQVDLKGRGNSAAQMLGSASGNVALLMGKGEISNILLEFVGLDGGEVIKFFLRGDRNVQLRCAAAAFDVKQGLMRSKTIVLDTTDTVINGSGTISLANEMLDITLLPQPKDRSILSLRSPLKIAGSFAAPSAGPDKVALAGRAGLAVALGLVNPLLALAATIETGPGEDTDCSEVLAIAADPQYKSTFKPKPKSDAQTQTKVQTEMPKPVRAPASGAVAAIPKPAGKATATSEIPLRP